MYQNQRYAQFANEYVLQKKAVDMAEIRDVRPVVKKST